MMMQHVDYCPAREHPAAAHALALTWSKQDIRDWDIGGCGDTLFYDVDQLDDHIGPPEYGAVGRNSVIQQDGRDCDTWRPLHTYII